MVEHLREITPTTARRLAVTRQRLAGPRPSPDPDGMMDVMRDIGCLQLDPLSVVARSHLLVMWSRVGVYDTADLDKLLWEERRLFEYWAHAASIVLTEDYQIHQWLMRRYASADSSWGKHVRAWLAENHELHKHVLTQLRHNGPVLTKDLEDLAVKDWSSSGWNSGRNVNRMLDYLWTNGQAMVAGRSGIQRKWDLAERTLPEWTPRDELPEHEVVKRAAQKSLRALGVASANQIKLHYTRHRYPGLPAVMKELEKEGRIAPIQIKEDGQIWPGSWFIHAEDLPLLERIEAGEWQPRTTLLSPFDNLICDRDRTELMFDFRFRIEIYVTKAQRQYGYYVLSILHGDKLIGRIDPKMDRKSKRLTINAVHAEPDALMTEDAARSVAAAINQLAAFLGAETVAYEGPVPEGWKKHLQE